MRKNGILPATLVALATIADISGASAEGDKLRDLVDGEIKLLPSGVTATYAAIEGDTIKGLAVHGAIEGATFDYTVGEIDLVNPNLNFAELWSAAISDPGKLTPDTAITLYDGATLKDVAFHLDARQGNDVVEGEGSVALITSKGVRLYPWAMTQPGVPSLADVQKFAANPPTAPDLDAVMPIFRFVAASSMAVAYDGLTAENTTYNVSAAQTVTYTVKRATAAGVDRGQLGSLSAEGIDFSIEPGASGSLERVTYSGFDMRQPLSKALVAPTLTPDMLDGTKLGKLEYSNLTLQVPDAPPIKLGSFSFADIVFTGAVPVSGRFALKALEVSKDAVQDPEGQEAFERLGLDHLTLSMGAAYTWNLPDKRIKLDDVEVKIDELGSLHFTAEVTEITPDMMGAMGAQLAHARLTYSDASLVDRVFKAGADMQQQDPAAFRQQMTDQFKAMSAAYTADSPALAAASQAVMEFLAAPKSLAVDVTPPKPLPIMQLSMLAGVPPAQLAAMMGLVVTANK